VKIYRPFAVVCFSAVLATQGANRFGVFDFNLRGKDPAEQIHSFDGIGFDRITMFIHQPKDLTRLEAFQAANRPNLGISIHQCHEMRGGNTDRLDAVMDAVAPYMDIATICGSDLKVNDNSKDWSDAIKPLGEGDYDPKVFLRALKRHNFKGPIILHTFGLEKKAASHYQTSFDLYQKMRAEVDAE
jgi:hypothetical protein